MSLKIYISNNLIYKNLKLLKEFRLWAKRKFYAPSPSLIKRSCLFRNGYPNSIWIETGTYLGETTKFLSRHASIVYSIEPEPKLFSNAKKYLAKYENVKLLNGTSEKIFQELLPKITGNVNFWLDGHYSAGSTYKGLQDTPIIEELMYISENLQHFNKVCVLIDDVRCFNSEIKGYSMYPSLDSLVDWARANKLVWHIEHDIFVAKTKLT